MGTYIGVVLGAIGFLVLKSGLELRPWNKANTAFLVVGAVMLAVAGYLISKQPTLM